MIRSVGLTILMLLLTSASVDGQRRDRDRDHSHDGPVGSLLELRERIALTDPQVEQLLGIDAQMDAQNEPLVTRLVQLRRSIRALGRRRDFTPEQRAQYEILVDEARPLMKQIRENNNAAMRQIGTVLTEAQREQVSRILKERDDDDDDHRRGDSQRSRRN